MDSISQTDFDSLLDAFIASHNHMVVQSKNALRSINFYKPFDP